MSQAFHCLPSSLWQFDPTTPKGFYFNRGVFYFGKKIENEMGIEENRIRKVHKNGGAADKLVTAARLAVLEKNLGIPVKRHRNPDDIASSSATKENEEEVIFLKAESG